MEAHTHDEVIGGKGLAEARLRVPKELRSALAEPFRRPCDSFFLFIPQDIGQALIPVRGVLGCELIEIVSGFLAIHLKPFCIRLAVHMGNGAEIVVKVVIGEGKTAAVLV